MLEKIKENSKKNIKAVKLLIILSAFFYLAMATNLFFILPDSGFTSFNLLDTKLFYSSDTFYSLIANMTPEMKSTYIIIHIVDYLFIFSFYPLLILLTLRKFKDNMNINWLVIIPIIAMLSDIIENIIIDVEILSSVPLVLASVISAITIIKFASILITIILYMTKTIKFRASDNNG